MKGSLQKDVPSSSLVEVEDKVGVEVKVEVGVVVEVGVILLFRVGGWSEVVG